MCDAKTPVDDAKTPLDDEIRVLLEKLRGQEPEIIGELFSLLDEDLRSRARQKMVGYGPQTLQPTALVNEAYIRLITSQAGLEARTYTQFVALVRKTMDHILTDGWRRRRAQKRGGNMQRLPDLPDDLPASAHGFRTLEAEAPERYFRALACLPERSRRMVELRRHGASPDLIAATMPKGDRPDGETPTVRTVQRILNRGMRLLWALMRMDEADVEAHPGQADPADDA